MFFLGCNQDPEPCSGSDVDTLRGSKEDVENAIMAEIKAKAQHHKFLISNARSHIQKIMDDTLP